MYAYFFDLGTIWVTAEYIDVWERCEPIRLCAIVVDETRGKARQRFIAWCKSWGARTIEWTTPMTTRKLGVVEVEPCVDTGSTEENPLRGMWQLAHERDLV